MPPARRGRALRRPAAPPALLLLLLLLLLMMMLLGAWAGGALAQQPLFCEFGELVGSLEAHVRGGGDSGGAHDALWARCRDVYGVFGGMNLPNTHVKPACGVAAGPVCEWLELMEVYLLQDPPETAATPLLAVCATVRDMLAAGSCARSTAGEPEPEPVPVPPMDLVDANLSAGVYNLSVSGSGVLATLVQVSTSNSSTVENGTRRRLAEGGSHVRGSAVPVARSYNGNDWEGSMPSPLSFKCSGQGCATVIPATTSGSYTYELRVYNATELVAPSPEKAAARFLTQATLGPKRDEIRDLSAGSLEETEARIHDWVHAQMNDVEPSLHRAYLRHRFNPYASSSSGTTAMRSPCKEGSSWVDIAFSRVDQGKFVDVALTADNSSFALSIDGVVRTVVSSVTDIRQDTQHNCYARGFSTPLDNLPDSGSTEEIDVDACHARCVRTANCAYFNFLPTSDDESGECHLGAGPSSGGPYAVGGKWRTGTRECAPYQYPSGWGDPTLLNMGMTCWGYCGAHGSCPARCGSNGFCCKYGRDYGGCVTTDPTKTSHRCIPDPSMPPPPPPPVPVLEGGQSYAICWASEYAGGDLTLLRPGVSMPSSDWKASACQKGGSDVIVLGNPIIVLTEPDTMVTQLLDGIRMEPITVGGEMNRFVLRNVTEELCSLPDIPIVFLQDATGKHYRHEARMELLVNTIDSPNIERRVQRQKDHIYIPSLTPSFCPATTKSYANARGCVRRNACADPDFSSGSVVLDGDILRQFFRRSNKYVYYIADLRIEGFSDAEISPCLVASRWAKSVGACQNNSALGNETQATLTDALETRIVLDTEFVRIIDRPLPGGSCTTQLNGVSAVGAQLTVNDTCYRQVHPDEFNVYDFGYWTTRHPGNRAEAEQGRPNPIQNPARTGEVHMSFPSWHGMDRWDPTFSTANSATVLRLLGVYGQEVEFSELPTTVQSKWLADFAGAVDVSSQDAMLDPGGLGGSQREACGSFGEVENRVELGHKYGGRYTWAQKPTYDPTSMLWVNAVFRADDQLRQRVAWALSQVYVVAKIGFQSDDAEAYAAYYDIFVRNAFGNFGEMLKDVAYSVPMGRMLTFINSQSAASSGNFADENFARESIQLFTVGLYHLHSDGTPVLDDAGNPRPAYDVKDVASFARAWTGFVQDTSNLRSNTATRITGSRDIDPMHLSPAHRDASPKMDLVDGFIGDGFPACTDLPADMFLRKGTRYQFLGGTLVGSDAKGEVNVVSLSLDDAGSPLYRELCARSDGSGQCTFPDEVVLSDTLLCHGDECAIDMVLFLRMDAAGRVGYYQYVPPACTNFPFFAVGALVKYGTPWHNDMSCSDAKALAAAPVCCNSVDIPDGDPVSGVTGEGVCEYSQERVSYQTAVDRCAALGKGLCSGIDNINKGACHPYSNWRFSTWLSRPCSTQVQIQRDGRVNVVHDGKTFANPAMATNIRITPEEFADVISIGSRSIFDVIWHENAFPRADLNCSSLCTLYGESCVCDVAVEVSAVFTDASRIPSRGEVLQRLHIGAVNPEQHDRCRYSKCTSVLCNSSAPDVQVWTTSLEPAVAGTGSVACAHSPTNESVVLQWDTIFEVLGTDGAKFYMNKESRVSVQDFSFRNPPTLINYEHPTDLEAATETDAVLDHLVTHPSTAPFVCKKLIQRLTSSNPSPRYVKEVATAFRSGIYKGHVYSGKYGDLGAAVAAIFLDREARDATLDVDPAAGKLREPLLKVIHLLRSLDFKPRNGMEIELGHMEDKVGQYAYSAPSIFNFYLPDHTPAGPVSRASLHAPEAEILSTPFVIGYMNGVASLVENGLTACDDGFAGRTLPSYNPHLFSPQQCNTKDTKRLTNEGGLEYIIERSQALLHNQSSGVLEELSLLLTSGNVPPVVSDYYAAAQRDHPAFSYTDGPTSDPRGCISAHDDWNATRAEATERCNQDSDCGWLQGGDSDPNAPASRWRACGPRESLIEVDSAVDTSAYSPRSTLIKHATDISELLPDLIKLWAYSAEFHASNLNVLQTDPRPALANIPSQHRPYKAIIVLFMEGGADSFSMLIPLSGCGARDMYVEYAAVRGNVALTTSQILPMAPVDMNHANSTQQPCTTFGTHPELDMVQTLWNAGEASWFANIGSLVEPLTLEEWNTNRKDGRTARKPPSLFGHDTQQLQCQSVHSDNTGAKGVLGRFVETLTTQDVPYRSNVYSMYGIRKLVEGDVPPVIMSLSGIQRFGQYNQYSQALRNITSRESRSIFADTYSGILEKALEETERLGRQMVDVALIGDYSGNSGLENVARTIGLRSYLDPAVISERDVFMVGKRTFDSHANLYSMNAGHLRSFNQDLQALHTDLSAIGMWESVTVVTISDFARTLSSNGLGTDHAWGGNMFILGGSVAGGRIHGQFPDDLNPATSQLEVGRGRGVLIPTIPWEGMWWGVGQWFGVEDDQLLDVLPNAVNFEEKVTLLTREQLFIN